MKRAALYARVSTAGQEEEETIENQLMVIHKRINDDGNILIAGCEYKDDGWTGGILERPALDKLRQDARDGLFEIVYVYDRGRLAREIGYQEIVIMELRDREVEFVTIQDSDDPTFQKFQGLFYEMERTKIYERFRLGKIRKTKDRNLLLGYNPLYGYDYIPRTKEQNGYFVINGQEAEVVKKIFNWVAFDGLSTTEIVKRLYEEGIPPRKGMRTVWSRSPVAKMLRDTSYYGEHYYLKTEAIVSKNPNAAKKYHRVKKNGRRFRPKEDQIQIQIPAIIDKETFLKAQEQLGLNAKYTPHNRKSEYLLASLVYCPCGRKRVGEKSAEHLYYRCSDRLYNYPLPRTCMEKGINAKILDELVYNKLISLFNNESLVKIQAQRWLDSQKNALNAPDDQLGRLKKNLEKLGEEEQRYLRVYGSGITSFEVYENQMKDLNSRKSHLQNAIIELESNITIQNVKPPYNPDSIYEKAIETAKKFRFQDRQSFVRKVINQVVTNQAEALVKGYLPLDFEEVGDRNVGFKFKYRYCRPSQRWQKHIVQCADSRCQSRGGQLSFLYY